MEAKLLCVGDMHLGRRPARIPSELGLDADELTPRAAWRRVVELALSERVDAVLLAGDVVESQNRFFEAFGVLERGVRDLAAAGVRVIAVAGNHDVEVLPRLADEIAGFHLLGRGGKWETVDVARDGRTLVRIVGWSFPERAVATSPLASFAFDADSNAPSIGLLHCDLDAASSVYAPVARRELAARALDLWLLGHVHAPSLAAGERPIGYLGSLQGLDPTETGVHGPWIVRAGPASKIAFEQVALAPLRWESLDVAVDDLELDDVPGAIVRAIGEFHRAHAMALSRTLAVGCRVTLVGRTAHGARLRRRVREPDFTKLVRRLGETDHFVDRVTVDTRPEIDLEALAQLEAPPGLLARRILALERGADSGDGESDANLTAARGDGAALLHAAHKRLERVASHASFEALTPTELEDPALRRRLARAGMRVLEDLLAQHESAP